MEHTLLERASLRRRRSRGFVTQNACTECRRRRAKCDGQKPCSSCAARNLLDCMYEVPTRVSKENMRREIEQLQERLYVAETVIDALVIDQSSDPVLRQLRDKAPLSEIADQIYKSFPSLRSRPAPPRQGAMSSETDYGSYKARDSELWRSHLPDTGGTMQSWKGAGYIHSSQELIEDEHFNPVMQGVDTQWTEVSSDKAMIEQMFALYFCWEYPIFQTLSREHFISDFKTGTQRYCSNLLVNALLALGCRLSVQQESQSNPDDDSATARRFFDETKRLLAIKNTPLLPAVQALGLMSLYEASCGHDSESWFFSCQSIQLAIEMGLHIEMPIHGQITAEEQEVRTVTFWGAFSLHQAWSLATGRLPSTSKAMARVAKYPSIESSEINPWVPYRDESIAQERNFEQPSNIRSIHRSLCKLSDIIHDSLYGLYTPGGNLSSTILLEIYAHHLAWKGSLPEVCHLSANPLPAVFFLHMYYNFALIMLFRPFIKLRLLGSAISPLEVCIQAANNVSSLLRTYRQTYSLRQIPVLVPYMLLASTITHLATLRLLPPPHGGPSSSVLSEIAQWQLLTTRYPFSRRAISIVKFFARQWSLDLHFTEPMNQAGSHDDQCLPIPGTMNFFCPSREVLVTTDQKRIDTDLFRPFPMQGSPLLSGAVTGMERRNFS